MPIVVIEEWTLLIKVIVVIEEWTLLIEVPIIIEDGSEVPVIVIKESAGNNCALDQHGAT